MQVDPEAARPNQPAPAPCLVAMPRLRVKGKVIKLHGFSESAFEPNLDPKIARLGALRLRVRRFHFDHLRRVPEACRHHVAELKLSREPGRAWAKGRLAIGKREDGVAFFVFRVVLSIYARCGSDRIEPWRMPRKHGVCKIWDEMSHTVRAASFPPPRMRKEMKRFALNWCVM